MARVLAVSLLTVVGLCLGACGAPAAQTGVVADGRIDARLHELTVRSPALGATTKLRVLLPRGYDTSRRRYPVLYVLHGANDDYTSWTRSGDAERLTAHAPLIVVMPDAGRSGWYTDWFNGVRGGPPRWERYHIGELLSLIDHRYRTIARRGGRAIAGLSMGGFGAMSYAARHPDRFISAAAFSGAVDGLVVGQIAPVGAFGPIVGQRVRLRGHDPWTLAGNLRSLHITLRTGDGRTGGPLGGGDAIEAAVHAMSLRLHRVLTAYHIRHVWDDYGRGGHTWPYWRRDLRETLPSLMGEFTDTGAAPSRVTHVALEPRYAVFGWNVAIRRRALELSKLSNATRAGFVLKGSGSSTVRTPQLYRPHARLRATVRDARGSSTRTIRVDAAGRVTVAVSLGTANAVQHDLPGQTPVRTARVTLR
jgi:S-formylglutathione hydrolase FrmB